MDGLNDAGRVDRLIMEFMDEGNAKDRDTTCVERMAPPPFAISPTTMKSFVQQIGQQRLQHQVRPGGSTLVSQVMLSDDYNSITTVRFLPRKHELLIYWEGCLN